MPAPHDLLVRVPLPAESDRAAYLLREVRLPPGSQLLVAVRSRPVERFVAAAAWWGVGPTACFRLAAQPGIARAEACGLLIRGLLETAKAAGMESLRFAEALAEDTEWAKLLLAHGFTVLRSERYFEVNVAESWDRTMGLYEKYQSRFPASWRTVAIRQVPPELIFPVIAPFRLMPPEELRDCWRGDPATGFDLDLSSILMDGNRPLGAMLVRRDANSVFIDIRVVNDEHPVVRALGNVLLFHHIALHRDRRQEVRWLRFRGGATEHRETANLAFRMGGRELPSRHDYARAL